MKRVVFTTLLLVLFFTVAAVLPYHSFEQKSFSIEDFLIKNSSIDTSKLRAAGPLIFGGLILTVIPCTCSVGYQITIGPPVPASVLYIPGASTLFAFYKILVPSSWALGTYIPPATCLVGVAPFCTAIPVQGTIFMVGTS